MNQCDGCRRGLPVNEHGHHRGEGSWDIIGCTAHLYDELPEPVGVVSTLMEPATSKTITKPKLFKRCEDLPAGTYLHTEEQLREAVRRERAACAAMFDDHPHAEMFRREIADAIRSRSEQGKD